MLQQYIYICFILKVSYYYHCVTLCCICIYYFTILNTILIIINTICNFKCTISILYNTILCDPLKFKQTTIIVSF